MIIFPATDIIGGKAVRLTRGNYAEMTVYADDPLDMAKIFKSNGAKYLHAVDLEGARDGGTPNFDTVKRLIDKSGLNVEIGGGIRDMETVDKYLSAGAFRVILGTAALTDRDFLRAAVKKYGDRVAVGVDLKDGFVAIKGWTETSSVSGMDFIAELIEDGVSCVICTDISKDGVLGGTNEALYAEITKKFPTLNLVASGGISDIDTVKRLTGLGIYGAILGKAIYTGALSLADSVKASEAKNDN